MRNYIVYSNSGAIDNITASEGYTIEDYISDCEINGCEYKNITELYLVEVSE